MKTILLLLSLIICFNCNAQKTIDYDKIWSIFQSNQFGPPSSFRLAFMDEIVINNEVYLELYSTNDSSQIANWGTTNTFMREDSLGRIYRLNNLNEEELLYNYNLQLNDSITVKNGFHICELKVTLIDSILLLDGSLRKRLTLGNLDGSVLTSGNVRWVEGIGSLSNIIEFPYQCAFDYLYTLLCYYEEDEIVYDNPQKDYCFIISSTDEPKNNKVSVYPNPAKNVLTIDSEHKIDKLILYHTNGNEILKLYEPKNIIEIDQVSSGIYFLAIYINDERTMTKLLIQNTD